MISLAAEPLRIRLLTFGPQPSKTAAMVVDRALGGLAERPARPRGHLPSDRSSAKATDASGRITATTEISVTLVGSANDLRCLAAASDCFEPSVATMTCMSDLLRGRGCVVPVPRLPKKYSARNSTTPTPSSPAHQTSESGSS